MEAAVNRSLLLEHLRNHEAIQELVKTLNKDIAVLQNRIVTERSDTLPDKERDRLFDMISVYNRVLAYFSQDGMHELEKEVTKQYEYVKSQQTTTDK